MDRQRLPSLHRPHDPTCPNASPLPHCAALLHVPCCAALYRTALCCVVPQGFFGADCALSLASDGKPELLAGLGYRPRSKPPKIYVYDLPPAYTVW